MYSYRAAFPCFDSAMQLSLDWRLCLYVENTDVTGCLGMTQGIQHVRCWWCLVLFFMQIAFFKRCQVRFLFRIQKRQPTSWRVAFAMRTTTKIPKGCLRGRPKKAPLINKRMSHLRVRLPNTKKALFLPTVWLFWKKTDVCWLANVHYWSETRV